MANGNYINIDYPFKNSNQGFFLKLNDDENEAIKSDLLHLILTRKGQRLYNPEFGTDLLKFIFEPQDDITLIAIKSEITNAVKRYLPQLDISEISITESNEDGHAAILHLKYTITDGMFSTPDEVTVNI